MKIENLRTEIREDRKRVVATVVWENLNRKNQDIYFETTEEFSEDLSCDPNAFLVACIVPAMHYGENRVFIDAGICPELKDGLITVMHWLCHWYGENRKPVEIDAKTMSSPPNSIAERAGFFFSGGVDSLAALRYNRLNFPLSHPGSLKDGLLIYGIESYAGRDGDRHLETFDLHINAISKVAHEAGINLIPIYTNVKSLEEDWDFWKYEFQGAVLSAAAHTFSKRLTKVLIAATYDIPSLEPWGSHPLIDPHFSSTNLHIQHDGICLSRLDKIKLLSDWDIALENMKVCFLNRTDVLNCGRCEKCVRTMTGLLSLESLERATAFSENNVSENLIINRVYIDDSYVEACYRDMMQPLSQQGRDDLVRAIQKVIDRYHEKDLKGVLKRIDRALFRGNILKRVKGSKGEPR